MLTNKSDNNTKVINHKKINNMKIRTSQIKEELIQNLKKEMKRSVWDSIHIKHPDYDPAKQRFHGYYINPWNLRVRLELYASYSVRKKLYNFIWEMRTNGKNLNQGLKAIKKMGYTVEFIKNL